MEKERTAQFATSEVRGLGMNVIGGNDGTTDN